MKSEDKREALKKKFVEQKKDIDHDNLISIKDLDLKISDHIDEIIQSDLSLDWLHNYEITKEQILDVANRYGLVVDFNKEPGLYVGDEKIEIEDLFPDIFDKN